VKGANLYVCNLPKSCTVDELQELFAAYGDIIQCRILTDQKTSQSKGIGFVLFNTRDQAELALSNLNLKTPQGCPEPLQVSFAEDRGRTNQGNYITQVYSPGGAGGEGGMEMYGATAGYGMNDYYGAQGSFYDNSYGYAPKVPSFRGGMRGGAMRGLGMRGGGMRGGGMRGGLGGSPLRGRGALAGGMMRSRGASQRFNPMAAVAGGVYGYGAAAGDTSVVQPEGHIVFAYNIGSATTEDDIRQLFCLYGSVVKVDVIWDFEQNTGKGFGFITMPDYEEAAYAISQLNGYNYAGKPLQVSFKSGK